MKRLLLFLAAFAAIASTAFAQVFTIRGSVKDDSGEPLAGVSVLVKGTQIGTVTDVDGTYTLRGVPANAQTLVFSFIGMETQEVPVQPNVNVVMYPDSEALEEAVVTIAYGAAKKSTLTGAIASVSSEQLVNRPTSSVTSALEGTVSGVQINSTIGSPGNDPHVYIRGVGTINGSSSILYILDGVAFGGNISDLNPADIESITVLKDAASAALYGNRASNGVILITTKKGSQGRLQMNLDIKQGVYQRGIPEYKLADARTWMEIYWQAMKNEQIANGSTPEEAAAYTSENLIADKVWINVFDKAADKLFDNNGKMVPDARISDNFADDLDWYKFGLRNGRRSEYNFSGNGATEKSDYFFSLGYLDENGYVTNSGFERFSARANVNIRPVNWFKGGLNINATHQNYSNTNGNEAGASSYTNLFMFARQIAPVYPAHLHYNELGEANYGQYILDANGNKQWDGGDYLNADGATVQTRNQYPDRHVHWENELNKDVTFRNTMNATATADFYFLKDFTFTVTGNMATRIDAEKTYNSAVIGDGKSNNGRGGRYEYNYVNWQLQEHLRWNHQFGDHNVNVLAGHENYAWDREYLYAYKTAEVLPGKNNLKNFTELTETYSYSDHYRTESFLGRVRYAYLDKYNLEASFRRDGSSRFGEGKKWGNFWSVGANWMISREPFMQPITWVNSLKLRADYGEVGNDASAGYYADRLLYTAGKNDSRGAFWLSQLESPDIKWETSASWGIGVEARLFNRWNLNAEYFDKRNRDLIFNVNNPLSAGATDTGSAVSTVAQNLGTISNHGVEIETDFDVIRTRDLRLNVMGNVSFIRNKVVTLPEKNKDGIISGTHKIMEGHDRYEYFVYRFMGVDQMTGRSLYKFDDEKYYITEDNTKEGKVLFGQAENKDGDANTLMTADNYTIINGTPYVFKPSSYGAREFTGTSSLPKAFGSFGLNLIWKNFSVSSLFTYGLGAKVYDDVYAGLMSLSGTPSSKHEDLAKAWTQAPAGMKEDAANRIDPNGIPQVNTALSSDNNAGTTDRWLISGNYLVLKNLSVSYQLPKKWIAPLSLQGVTLSANVENLKTWSARQGLNPQQSRGGVQSNYLVTPRVMTLALNVRF